MIPLQGLSGTIRSLGRSLAAMGMRYGLALVIVVLPWLNTVQAAEEGLRVALLLSERNGPYLSLATALREELATRSADRALRIDRSLAGTPDLEALREADLVITIGSDASQRIADLQTGGQVLHLLIPSTATIHPDRNREQHSAIYIDQPWERQLNLIELALPGTRHVAMLLGPTSREQRAVLERTLETRQWHHHIGLIPESGSYLDPLRRVLEQAEVLLAVPDQRVFNRQNLQGILLTSYRREVPMIGFSPGYVRAGALVAVYSTPEQIAHQAVEWILPMLDDPERPLPEAQFPTYFSVAVNHQVARSLGLRVPEEETLLKELRRLEELP